MACLTGANQTLCAELEFEMLNYLYIGTLRKVDCFGKLPVRAPPPLFFTRRTHAVGYLTVGGGAGASPGGDIEAPDCLPDGPWRPIAQGGRRCEGG